MYTLSLSDRLLSDEKKVISGSERTTVCFGQNNRICQKSDISYYYKFKACRTASVLFKPTKLFGCLLPAWQRCNTRKVRIIIFRLFLCLLSILQCKLQLAGSLCSLPPKGSPRKHLPVKSFYS